MGRSRVRADGRRDHKPVAALCHRDRAGGDRRTESRGHGQIRKVWGCAVGRLGAGRSLRSPLRLPTCWPQSHSHHPPRSFFLLLSQTRPRSPPPPPPRPPLPTDKAPAPPLLCRSPLWNNCISNQFFVHSHSLHFRPVSSFFFHHHRSGDISCKSETLAYTPFDRADHALPNPTLSFPSPSSSPPPPTASSAAAATSLAGTTSATPSPPLGSPSRRQPMITTSSPPSPSSSMSRTSTTSN